MKLSKNTLLSIGALVMAATLGTLLVPKAVKAAAALLVQDIDQPARAPFVTTVTVDPVNNFTYTPVTIPAGQRLVIDNISISGAAQSTQGVIQPIVILAATVAGGQQNLYYFAPQQDTQGGQLSSQFYSNQQATIYADSLQVGPAFAGFSPSFDTLNVVITGHLINNP